MKHLMKRSLSMLMALLMIFSLFSGMSFAASAAEGSIVDYQYAYVSDTYPSVIKNWGTRGELATFLSPNAEAFYAETSLDELAALAGSSDTATVHESALYVALQQLMANAQTQTTSYDATRDLYQYTDIQENGGQTTKISAFYSGTLVGPAWDQGATWNREHTWPNSKGGEGDQTHENDIMMLRPEAGNINSSRSNKAYGTTDAYFDPNLGSYNLHGDVARIMLYTFVRWGGVTETAEDGTVTYTNQTLLDNMWGESGVIESLDVLLAWAEEDPVDTWELARNDSVQSITGTRNVFVDYPELVFELFEAEVPAGYDTPSGSANAASFTITASVSGEGGEVSVNGEHVTVHPYAGYQVSSVVFSDGTTYTSNGDVFTVTSAADCTVTVTFDELDSYTVNVYENGEVVATAEVYDGNIYRLPEFSGTLPDGYSFVGWVSAEYTASAAKPSVVHTAGTELTIDDDYNYYALLTYLNTEDKSGAILTYELVDSAEDLVVGSSYVITGSTSDKALSTTQNKNNRGSANITKSGNVLVFTEDAGVAELILGEGIAVTEPEATEAPETEPSETEPGTSSGTVYQKVTSAPSDWAGTYLIVYEDSTNAYIFNGVDAVNGYVSETITNNTIPANETTNAVAVTIEAMDGGYAVKTPNGYIYGTSGSNKLNFNTSTQKLNSVAMDTDGSVLLTSNTSVLRFNAASNQMRFRYYKAASYSSQKAIALYKKVEATAAAAEKIATRSTSTPTYTFYDAANTGYLYAASSSSNYLKTQADVSENACWNITVNTDGSCTLVATGANTRNDLRYNGTNGSDLFACYASTNTMEAVSLYVGVPGAGTMYYTTAWGARTCEHANTTTTTVDATCGADGSTTVTCNDCSATVSVTPIPATGNHANTTTTTVEATCLTAGSTTVVCDDCGNTISTTEIPAGHTIVDGVCSVCHVVTVPVAGTAYKFGMIQGNKDNTIYYINGAMNGYYMDTVEIVADSADVYLEETEGGYYFYTMVDGAKKYINMVVSGTYVNGAFEDTASTVYTFNSEKYTIIATVNNAEYWFGTRNDKTFTTMGPVKVSYNGFYGQFYYFGSEEIAVTAADGVTQLQNDIKITYNGITLPTTVTVADVIMNVSWSIETSDAAAAQIVDGKLVLAPQAAAATYTLTATVKNGETDTATATWTGSVVPTSAAIADGTYVLWLDGKAVSNVYTDTSKNYGYLAATEGIVLDGETLSGHTTANIFTLTAIGDGTYTITDSDGNYLYSDMSIASSNQFNVGAKPEAGYAWTIVAIDAGYNIYNVDRAAAITYSTSYNNFALYSSNISALAVTAVDPCVHANQTTTTVDPSCIVAGSTTVTCDDCGMTLTVTEIPATGHSYVDGICSACQGKDPYVYGTKYYIAAVRSEGNYMYMTSDVGTASTKRYQAADSGMVVAPVNIEPDAAQTGYVFILMPNDDGTYYIIADGVEGNNYLGWTTGNSGILVGEADAIKATLTENTDGTYVITFTDSASKTRNLALNSNASYQYFAWYTSTQVNALSLIPVAETVNQVNQYGVVLTDGILAKFNVCLKEGSQLAITLNGKTKTYNADQLSSVVNGTYDAYVELAAAQMADEIEIAFTNDGVTETKTYTVKEYAETILNGEYDDVTKTLVTEMLAYGAAAQTYFGHKSDNLVYTGSNAGTAVPVTENEMSVTGSAEGIKFYGASLVFENKIAIRYYFQVSEGATLTVADGYTIGQNKGMYYVEIADILPQDLDESYSITVNGGITVSYSPLNYLVRMYKNGTDNMKALVKALYNYHVAAVAYVNANAAA